MNLAASLEVLQPGKCLVFVQAGGSRDHPGRERAGHLAQRRSQAIPIRLGPALLSVRLRRQDRRDIGGSGFGCGLTSYRRVVTEASAAAAAQDHRLTSRAGGPPQTDANRAPSDRRRSDAPRAPSRSSPHRSSALDGHHRKALGNRRRFAGHGIHGLTAGAGKTASDHVS